MHACMHAYESGKEKGGKGEGVTYSAGLRRSRRFQSDCAPRSRTWSRRRCRRSRSRRSPWRLCRLVLRIPGDWVALGIVVQKKGGFFPRRWVYYTHGTTGELSKGSTLNEGSGCSEGCGQEGESSDGVLHFRYFFFSIFFFWP